MRSEKLIPGLILILIGVVILLDKLGYINFDWYNLIYLWPLFLILGGINLILINQRAPWATAVRIAAVLLAFGVVIFGRFNHRNTWWPGHYNYTWHDNDNNSNDDSDNKNDDDDDNSDTTHSVVKVHGESTFNEPYQASVKSATLNINGAATVYTIADTTSQLFNAVTEQHFGNYTLDRQKDNDSYVLTFRMQGKQHGDFQWSDDKSNTANIKLNANPEWDVNVDAGATKINFDLAKFKVRNVNVHGAAGDFSVKLGQPLANTNVEIDNAASSVTISIPQNAACHIDTHTFLTSHNFDGFNKTSDGDYETPGYANAPNKIYIKINGAMSDFKVKRY